MNVDGWVGRSEVGLMRLFDDANFGVGDGEGVEERVINDGHSLEVLRTAIRFPKSHQMRYE